MNIFKSGKSQLLDQFSKYYPARLKEKKIKRYIEPFVGAGAVFFELNSIYNFNKVILNDINPEIILCYKVIKENVYGLMESLNQLKNIYMNLDTIENKSKFYYKIRDEFNEEKITINYIKYNSNWIQHASQFVFLNKTCFNGLYRVNKNGKFNVPFNKSKTPKFFNEENLLNINKSLQNTILTYGDFQSVMEYVDKDTFLYIDPPYRPLNKNLNFNGYSEKTFNDESQIRLANWIKKINDMSATFMLSNSDPKNISEDDNFFDELYKEFKIYRISANRMINCKGDARKKVSELLVTN